MNFKLTHNQFRYLLVFSVALNIVMFFFAAAFYYNRHFKQQKTGPDIPAGKVGYFLNRQNVYKLFPVTSTDIVLAGDSQTQLYDSQEYLKDYKIVNRGINGDISVGLLNRLDGITIGHPKKLFIQIGFNDIRHQISPDSIIKHIHLMFIKVKHDSPSTIVYMVNIFPSSSMRYNIDLKSIIPVVNQKIASLCSNNGIAYIDAYAALSDNGSLNKNCDGGDGIHLSAEGYTIYTKILKLYL